jgi:hypothetical protein
MKILKLKKTATVVAVSLAAIGLVGLLFSLFNKNKKQYSVKPPIDNLDVVYQEFTYQPSKGANFVDLCFGHQVNIAPYSLVDQNGKPIDHEVSLEFRSFNNAEQIFLSGIPMDSQYGQLQSAGMFELKPAEKGVFIAKDGDVSVNLVSKVSDPTDYNSYLFEEGNGWVEIERFKTEENVLRKESIIELDTLIEIGDRKLRKDKERRKRTENYFQLDFKANQVDGFNANTLDNSLWEYIEVKGQDNPFNRKNQRRPWSDVRISKNSDGTYNIRLLSQIAGKRGGETEITFKARPVNTSDNPEEELAKLDATIQEMDQYFAALEEQRRLWTLQQNIYNTFRLAQWGIFNCDKVFNEPTLASGEVDFRINGDDPLNGTVYILYDSINTVVTASVHSYQSAYDLLLTQDYDGELELFVFTRNGELYKNELKLGQVPPVVDFKELASIIELESFVY